MSQGELARRTAPEDFIAWVTAGAHANGLTSLAPDTVVHGGYPEAVTRSPARAARWFAGYVDRLADHDARDLQRGGYADHIRALLQLIGAGGETELVKSKLARTIGVSENSLDSYLRLATTMRLVSVLLPWTRSPRGRIARRPKVSLNDTGLAAHLAGFTSAHATTVGGREYFGALTEQFVALELRKQSAWSQEPFQLFHYRDLDGLASIFHRGGSGRGDGLRITVWV
ncbi:MAG: DUF4143 domain-containing protein [Micropruina sp.]|nr:DUF4143 domain-containing protein [Micropruina sp.]